MSKNRIYIYKTGLCLKTGFVKEMLKSRQARLHNCSYGDGTNTGAAF